MKPEDYRTFLTKIVEHVAYRWDAAGGKALDAEAREDLECVLDEFFGRQS